MRGELKVFALLFVVLAAGWLGYRFLFLEGGGVRFEVVEVRGDVRRADGGGALQAAEPGQALGASDRLVAAKGASAVLGLGPLTRITVEEDSSIRVVGVSAEKLTLDLEDGRVRATVKPGSGAVGIAVGGSEVVADDADLTIARDEDGSFGVYSERGDVGVKGVGGASQVKAGERLVVSAEGSSLLQPASESLLLYLAQPGVERTRESMATVTGKTQPGARVKVGDVEVRADAKGEFSARVPLREGENTVPVEVRDVLGNTSVAAYRVVRDTQAPAIGVEIRY